MPKSQQVAALPWRKNKGELEILLVTTRTTKRWLIPKGWCMEAKADHDAAAIEAFEEAGVKGDVNSFPVGSYVYEKILRSGNTRSLTVQVYALEVREEFLDWPERHERKRKWVSVQQAIEMIGEPELKPVVLAFGGRSNSIWLFFKKLLRTLFS